MLPAENNLNKTDDYNNAQKVIDVPGRYKYDLNFITDLK